MAQNGSWGEGGRAGLSLPPISVISRFQGEQPKTGLGGVVRGAGNGSAPAVISRFESKRLKTGLGSPEGCG